MSNPNPRWVLLARVLRARGNKGEVAAEVLTDFPERLVKLQEVFLRDAKAESEPRRIGLKSCWMNRNHRGQAVFHFEGIDAISEAEKFRGFEVLLPLEQRVNLPAGQYYVSDLIGCNVFETPGAPSVVSSSPCSLAEAPSFVGKVSDVQFTGEEVSGTPLLAVETSQGELLIPLAADFCTEIDTIGRRIEVRLPDGLRDLNRE